MHAGFFKRLNQTIQNSTIPQVSDYLQIAYALVNAYRAPAISSFSNDNHIAAHILSGRYSGDQVEVLYIFA